MTTLVFLAVLTLGWLALPAARERWRSRSDAAIDAHPVAQQLRALEDVWWDFTVDDLAGRRTWHGG